MKNQKGFATTEILAMLFVAGLFFFIAVRFFTGNVSARNFGGTMTYELAPNTKLVNVTWKEDDLWVLTSPRPASVPAQTYEFVEKSTLGVLQGKVIIIEK